MPRSCSLSLLSLWMMLASGCHGHKHASNAAGTPAEPSVVDAGAEPSSAGAAGKSGAGGAAGGGGQAQAGMGGRAVQAGASGSAGQPAAVSGNYVQLESDPGDYIGSGRTYHYTDLDAVLSFGAMNLGIVVDVHGDESWRGEFHGPAGPTQLSVGKYTSLAWSGEGHGCNTVKGELEISQIKYVADKLTELDLSFEQHCDGAAAALRGRIHYRESEHVAPHKPVQPPPAGLWEPAPGTTPASGRYVYLISEAGDLIGQGRTLSYTQANAQLTLTTSGRTIMIRVVGDSDWMGTFEGMLSIERLEPGYYGELERSVTLNPTKAGLGWSGEGRGCPQMNSWFVIDQISYAADLVTSIDLRFKQQCLGNDSVMYGKLHWTVDDSTAATGPTSTLPSDLWRPSAGQTPTNPRYVYLESSSGDDVGLGKTYAYTQANAVLTLEAMGIYAQLRVDGDESWRGEFAGPTGAGKLQPGYYANLGRYGTHNPTEGGLSWSGNSTTCNELDGWFAVDAVSYAADTLSTLDARFEQRCKGATGSLHGQVHWAAADATVPPGPVNPAPNGLWKPAVADLPATGSYVYLQSEPGDTIGEGQMLHYPIEASALHTGNQPSMAAYLAVAVADWQGSFVTMHNQTRLAPGYYGDLKRALSDNPAKGGLEWTGGPHVCNMLTGWFVIDSISYAGDAISALELRFEQHCEGAAAALHGALHLGG